MYQRRRAVSLVSVIVGGCLLLMSAERGAAVSVCHGVKAASTGAAVSRYIYYIMYGGGGSCHRWRVSLSRCHRWRPQQGRRVSSLAGVWILTGGGGVIVGGVIVGGVWFRCQQREKGGGGLLSR